MASELFSNRFAPSGRAEKNQIVDQYGDPLYSDGYRGQNGSATQKFARRFNMGPESGFAVPHVLTFSSILGSAFRNYYHGQYDEATRFSREDALAMRNDAYVMALLNERKARVATLKWHIEVDNPRDQYQKAMRDGLTQLYRSIPCATDLKLSGLEAIWFGRAGDQFVWKFVETDLPAMPRTASGGGLPTISVAANQDQRDRRQALRIIAHQPVEGDKIDYDYDGNPYILVTAMAANRLLDQGADVRQMTKDGKWEQAQYSDYDDITPRIKARHADFGYTTIGGRALYLKGSWRTRFRIHKHQVVDTSFFEPWKAGAVHGVGIRSVIFWYWWLRQEFLSNVTDWCARTGLGVKLWYYESGNAASKAAVTQAATDETDRVNIMVPYTPGIDRPALEVVETNGTGADMLLRIVKHIEDYLERYIVGQSMSAGSDDSSAGFGDKGRSEMAANTQWQITKLDAGKFDDTNTTDVLDVMKRWTYPEMADVPARMVSDVDDPDVSKWIEGAKAFIDMGGKIVADEARSRLGLSAPREGDETVGGIEALQAKQATSGHVKPPEGMAPDAGASESGSSAAAPPQDTPSSEPAEKQHYADASGHEHVGKGTPEGGQFTGSAEHGQSPNQMASKMSSKAKSAYDDIKENLGRISTDEMRNRFDSEVANASKEDLVQILTSLGYSSPSSKKSAIAQLFDNLTSLQISKQQTAQIGQHYEADAAGHEHKPAGEGGGQFTGNAEQGQSPSAMASEHKAPETPTPAPAPGAPGGAPGTAQSANLPIAPQAASAEIPHPDDLADDFVQPTKLNPQQINELLRSHNHLIQEGANSANKRGMDFHDAEAEANMALWKAAQKYDPATGPFENLARVAIARRLSRPVKGKSVKAQVGLADKEGKNIDVEQSTKPNSTAINDQRTEAVKKILPNLQEADRAIVERILIHGQKPIEVAAALGRTRGYVSKRLAAVTPQIQGMVPAEHFEAIRDELLRYDELDHAEEREQEALLRYDAARAVDAVLELRKERYEKLKHKFSSTQFNITGEVAEAIRKMAAAIPDDELAEDGRETRPHVTAKYGLHTDDADDVRKVVKDFGPCCIKLGKVSIFPASGDKDYDVVKVDVESEDLHRLNELLCDSLEHTDTHKEYHPHVTIAYVKAGKGEQYEDDDSLEGKEIKLVNLLFSNPNKVKTTINLAPEEKAPAATPEPSAMDKAMTLMATALAHQIANPPQPATVNVTTPPVIIEEGAVKIEKGAVHVETHLPKPGPLKVERDSKGNVEKYIPQEPKEKDE